MTPRMKISRAGLEFIKAYEGLRKRAAATPDGRWIVGFSHTETARNGMEVDEGAAELLLLGDLRPVVAALNDLIFAPLSQNQFDALASLAFNIGLRNFALSGMVRHINEGRIFDAAQAFDVWRRAEVDGRAMVVDGLVRRRAAERAMFVRPATGAIATPTAELQPLADPNAVFGAPSETPIDVPVDLEAGRAGAPVPVAPTARRDAEAAADAVVERLRKIIDTPSDAEVDEADETPTPVAAFEPLPEYAEEAAPPPLLDPEPEPEALIWMDEPATPEPAARSDTGFGTAVIIGGIGTFLVAAGAALTRSGEAGASAPVDAAWGPPAVLTGALAVASAAYLALRRALTGGERVV